MMRRRSKEFSSPILGAEGKAAVNQEFGAAACKPTPLLWRADGLSVEGKQFSSARTVMFIEVRLCGAGETSCMTIRWT